MMIINKQNKRRKKIIIMLMINDYDNDEVDVNDDYKIVIRFLQ